MLIKSRSTCPMSVTLKILLILTVWCHGTVCGDTLLIGYADIWLFHVLNDGMYVCACNGGSDSHYSTYYFIPAACNKALHNAVNTSAF